MAELAIAETIRRTRKACAFSSRVIRSLPAHAGADGEGHRGEDRQGPGEARQVRLHVDSFRVRARRQRSTAAGQSFVEDPWLCVPASRRVCPGRCPRRRSICSTPPRSARTRGMHMTHQSQSVEGLRVSAAGHRAAGGPRPGPREAPYRRPGAGSSARAARDPRGRRDTRGRPDTARPPVARRSRGYPLPSSGSVPAVPRLQNDRRACERGEDQYDPKGLSLQRPSHLIRTSARRRRW
jgi:hypothetical protein